MTFPFKSGDEVAELTIEESEGKLYVTMLTSTGPGALLKLWRFIEAWDEPLFFACTEEFKDVKRHLERRGAKKIMEVWTLGGEE